MSKSDDVDFFWAKKAPEARLNDWENYRSVFARYTEDDYLDEVWRDLSLLERAILGKGFGPDHMTCSLGLPYRFSDATAKRAGALIQQIRALFDDPEVVHRPEVMKRIDATIAAIRCQPLQRFIATAEVAADKRRKPRTRTR